MHILGFSLNYLYFMLTLEEKKSICIKVENMTNIAFCIWMIEY